MPILRSDQEWAEYLHTHPEAHILQTPAWGKFKQSFGWHPAYVVCESCGAQVLFRKLPLGLSIGYIPKGPLGHSWEKLVPDLDRLCRKMHAIHLVIEPDLWELTPQADIFYHLEGFHFEEHTIQPRRTIKIDLLDDEEQILAGMKQKTRYNIRLAEKKDIQVRESHDLDTFYELMQATAKRDGFSVHHPSYYKEAYSLFSPLGQCVLLEATYQDQPLAALMAFACGDRAWYFYGASTEKERQRMPTYLLQWEAMRWAKARGCATYDLWGVPDHDEAYLEEHFQERSNGLWGVYRFKRGFGGRLVRSVPAAVKVYHPLLYLLYAWYNSRRSASQAQV